MLALDSTIGCIEASEPDVLAMYGSAPLVTTKNAGSKPESHEAYVCAIRKKAQVRVYVALVADDKRIFVYTRSGEPDAENEYDRTLQEALDFAKSMGFTPERVNLNYSAAMREVVVRNIKILRPPGSKVFALLKHGMADAPTPADANRPATPKKHSPVASPVASSVASLGASPNATPTASLAATSVAPLIARPVTSIAPMLLAPAAVMAAAAGPVQPSSDEALAVLRGAFNRVADENRTLQKRTSEEAASLREKLARALSDSQREREQLAAVRAELVKDRNAQEMAYAEALANLKEELQTLSAERDAQSMQEQELSALHREAAAELATAGEACSRLISERDALVVRVEAIGATSSDLAALQREVAECSGARDKARRREFELAAENGEQTEALTGARQEIADLILEGDAAQKRAEQLAAENRTSLMERKALHREIVTLSAQREAALLRAEMAELAAEREMLQEQEQVQDCSFTGETTDPEPSGTRLQLQGAESCRTLEGFASPPHPNLAAVTEGWSQLPELPELILQRPQAETDLEIGVIHAAAGQLPEPPLFSEPDDDFFPSEEGLESCPGRFLLQTGLTAIEYAIPDDVVELHQSINVANLSPEGKGQESCRGYVCCMAKAGALRVFAALFGAKSGRTWVYFPEVQPEDELAYASAVRGAISFAEGVGFIMEPVQLGAASRQHDDAITRCPVLRCTDRLK